MNISTALKIAFVTPTGSTCERGIRGKHDPPSLFATSGQAVKKMAEYHMRHVRSAPAGLVSASAG